jgi:hypothetical protein
MDHSDVVRLQAVEKYVLGELPADLKDEFEEHYFDCRECATDVKALATFVAASRMVFEETARETAGARSERGSIRGWFWWLRPVIAVPAMAALVAVMVFQNVVTIPELKQQARTDGAGQAYSASYHLQGATRGENTSDITVDPSESFALDFDFTPAVTYQSYTGSLTDRAGNTSFRFRVSGQMANKEVHVVIPGGKVRPGSYDLVFAGEGEALNGNAAVSREVQRIPFTIENRRP